MVSEEVANVVSAFRRFADKFGAEVGFRQMVGRRRYDSIQSWRNSSRL
jgi:hypothetical protein